jgi:hypothetical protein
VGTLMLVNIVFDYNADIVSVPDSIGINIKKYRNQCDKWLFNKLNEHEFWEKDDSGNKLGVGVCSGLSIALYGYVGKITYCL